MESPSGLRRACVQSPAAGSIAAHAFCCSPACLTDMRLCLARQRSVVF
ncbi:hypothetical protein RHECNPAF_2190081 [Rhizobium etli CNPAF512]|nr:hypothetical protein RHECNPAF_2190081 [Rhizobium etli CNPAF512]